MQKIIGAVGFASAFFTLIACGDSNTTETVVEKGATDIVASVADLPKCTTQNEGEQIFVKENGLIRFCSDGKWYAVAGGENASCSTEALKDSSGIKIICNGDSVGVVLNGAKGDRGEQGIQGETGEKGEAGADGKDGSVAAGCTVETLADDSGLKVICGGDSVGVVLNGKDGEQGVQGEKGDQGEPGKDGVAGEGSASSCALVIKDCIVHVACDKDTVSLDIISKEDACNEIAILDSEQVAISLDSVKGASQKGPFLSGSKVLVKELLDGRTLSQTGNNFDGKILNDKGEFKITARMLVSQYVMLEATGYYRNEVTGENSNSPLTLFGITDVTTRNIVNINLLTHLEYERVIYLVTKEKMKVLEAKKQAQQEIFDILHINNSNFSNSEDLSIAGSSDEDGALLAFSILFQGDRSVSQLTELLTRVSTAMEKEGKWEDAVTKAQIADWAMAADTSDRLADIRGKVDAWKLGSMVPKFEPYIRNFWRVEHGLGLCGDSVKVGTVVKPSQGKTKAEVRFICAETDGDIRWRIATDIEKDTYEWAAGKDGEVKKGDVTDTHYLYNGVKKEWNKASMIETALLMGCVESRKGTFHKVNGEWFICENRSWESTKNIIVDTDGWIPGSDGDVKKGDNTDDYYVFDEIEGNWRTASDNEVNLNLKGCTTKRTGVMSLASSGDYYICQNVEQCEYNWNTGESVCTTHHWSLVENDVAYNTYGYVCDEEGKMVLGKVHTTSYFVCDAGEWRDASITEETLGIACTMSLQGRISSDDKLTCDNGSWRASVFLDFALDEKNWLNPNQEYGVLIDNRDGREYKTIDIGVHTWMAENLNYADSARSPYLRGQTRCNELDTKDCLKGGRLYSWTAAVNIDSKWQKTLTQKGTITSPHQGICPDGWFLPDTIDFRLLLNMVENDYNALEAVIPNYWPNATNSSGFSALPVHNLAYAYFWSSTEGNFWDNGTSAQNLALSADKEVFGIGGYNSCGKNSKNAIRCVKYNTECNLSNEGTVVPAGAALATCENGRWRQASVLEKDVYGIECNENLKRIKGSIYPENEYVCFNGKWHSSKEMVWTQDNKDDYLNPDIEYGVLLDSRDQQEYKTVTIGELTWMAQNLNYADSSSNANLKGNSWCVNDSPELCAMGGRLYSWTAVMNLPSSYKYTQAFEKIQKKHRGICPEGWHVPSVVEIDNLYNEVEHDASALQAKHVVNWKNASNSSGFSALPLGWRSGNISNDLGEMANMWAADEIDYSSYAFSKNIEITDHLSIGGAHDSKAHGMSLRCVKD